MSKSEIILPEYYLLCYFVGLHRILYRAIEKVDPPDSVETVLSPLQSSKEFPFNSDGCILELEARPEMTSQSSLKLL